MSEERPAADGTSWFDDEAGPVVRPYAMTGGRTAPGGPRLDLLALVVAESRREESAEEDDLCPEHLEILALCRARPLPVAELGAELDLPLGVVRVLVADLLAGGHVRVSRPVPPAEPPDAGVMRDVIDGLRSL